MATVVLIHGIAQEQLGAKRLESVWLPSLASGLEAAGVQDLADRVWPVGPNAVEVRMGFYGNLYIPHGAQGGGGGCDADLEDLDGLNEEQADLAEMLAHEWVSAAAYRALDKRDRDEAEQYLRRAAGETGHAQGLKAHLRPAINALAGLRWFAPTGMGAASLFYKSLIQVTRYLTEVDLRAQVKARVSTLIGPETRLVISHSLGTVVGYEVLSESLQQTAWITLGSPLGLRNVIYERLVPSPGKVPACVTRWDNFAGVDDLVASVTDLSALFAPQPGSQVVPVSGPPLDTGAEPHSIEHYLSKRSIGSAVAAALQDADALP